MELTRTWTSIRKGLKSWLKGCAVIGGLQLHQPGMKTPLPTWDSHNHEYPRIWIISCLKLSDVLSVEPES
jgi:hypothetical protein